jgi:hypothetical protein
MSKNASTLIKRSFIGLFGGIFLTGLASAQVQSVTGSLSIDEISAGQETVLTVTYTATDASGEETSTTGLGLRLHYDSSVIDMGEIADLLEEGESGNQIKDDVNDDDSDPSTDKYLLTTWFDFSGDWPDGETLPVTLYSVPLTAVSGFQGTTIKFSASSVPAGFTLSADDVAINKIPGTVSTLSSLTASYDSQGESVAVALTPGFDSATTDYSAQVANPVDSVFLVPVLTDSFASISTFTANGSAVSENTVDLVSGTNDISISVTAEDGVGVTTYSVAVDRAAALSVAISALDVITTANAASYAVAGTCNLDDVSVAVSLTDGTNSADANAVDCINNAWTVSADASGLTDGTISVSAVASTSLETDTASATTNKDTTGPTVNVPANITVNADSASGTAATNAAIVAFLQAATASDATDGSVTVSNDAPVVFGIGVTTVTFSALDSLGNVGSNTATVTVEDQSAPTVTPPAAITVAAVDANGTPATDAAIAAFLAAATASDNVDIELTITNDAQEIFVLGDTTVTFSATDSAGLTGSATAVVTVADQTAPVISVPAAITVAATDADGTAASDASIAAFLVGASATDNVDAEVLVTNDGLSVFPLGGTVVTFTATDTAGNSVSETALVTVSDQAGPVITSPSDVTIAATDADGTAATDASIVAFLAGATAVDNVDTDLEITNNAPVVFSLGDTEVIFEATDSAGNRGSASSVVTIADLTAPVINAVATLVVLGTEDGVPATEQAIVDYLASVTATDNVDGALTSIQNDGPADFYPFGGTTVTFTVSDAAGNQASAQTVINISLDIVDPELTVPDSISLTVDMPGDVVADSDDAIVAFLAGATATDNKDGDLTASIANDAPAEFEVGDTLVTFSVSDAAGNSVSDLATVSVSVLDTDNDGLPDFYETQNGLDPNDASDAEGDLDGDGISNLDEYLNGTDPTRDELPPELTIPEDIVLSATGRLTDVDIGQAVATDNKDGELTVSPSVTGPFESGLTEITWAVADEAGNKSSAVQRVEILPLANLTPSSITVEGAEVDVTVQLSGMAVIYPVTVPLTISGTATSDDYVLTDSVVISEGLSGSVVMSISEDAVVESDETVVIALGTPTNAVPGAVTERTVTIIEDNVAPVLTFAVSQGGTSGRIVAADAGLVSLIATYTDLNDGDTHTFSWGAGVADLPGVTSDESSISFDPSSLGDSIVIETASVTDSGNPSLTTTASVTIKVLAAAPVLDDSDSDGDGVSDADEGYGDSDNDGIPDYQDNIEESYLAPVGDDGSVAQSAVGTAIALGDTALASGDNQLGVDESDIGGEDADYSYLGGLADFELTGGQVGSSYNIVMPLSTPVPENAVLRKYMGEATGWQDFVEDANNAFSSAIAASGACPEPGSDLYSAGLLVGATCLQLQIEDGGPNDADGEADGTVTDPSGVATLYFGAPSSDSSVTIDSAGLEANSGQTATVTVTAVDSDGRRLEGMAVSGSANLGATLTAFSESGDGVYESTLTVGATSGQLSVNVTVSDGSESVSISSNAVTISPAPSSGGGGCTVGNGQSSDWSLMLLMLAALILLLRRRVFKLV